VISTSVALAFAPIGAIVAAASAGAIGWWWAPVLFVLGALAGFVAGAIASIPFVGASWVYQSIVNRRRSNRGFLQVTDRRSQAWTMCDLAWQIAGLDSWRDRTVDPERRAPSIVWSAVERITGLDREYPDAARALTHPSLKELAEEKIRRIEEERESLKCIEGNLRKVVDTARAIDAARAQTAWEREIAKQRRAEEQELRGRLTGNDRQGSTTDDVSNRRADESAGLAAEAKAIAGWLAESDRMLRDI
jgi:hypothetical protein